MSRRRTNAGTKLGYLILAGGVLVAGSGCVSSFSSSAPSTLPANPALLSGDPLDLEPLRQQGRARANEARIRREWASRARPVGFVGSKGGRNTAMPGAGIVPTPGAPAFSDPIVTPVYVKSFGAEYHVAGCSLLHRGNMLVIDRKNALDYGFTACSECGGGPAGRKRQSRVGLPNLPAFE